MQLKCNFCGKDFNQFPSRAARNASNYCSQACYHNDTRVPPEETFWKNVDKSESCWIWKASSHEFGYGQLKGNGQSFSAHRFSWIIHNGPIPEGQWVLHRCDNPGCVNPDHLFIGTHADNVKDMVSKDRHARGERNNSSKLTDSKVLEMRSIRDQSGISVYELAKQFGISPGTAWKAVTKKSWKHVS